MLWFLMHEPVVSFSQFLNRAFAPPWHPVLLLLIIDKSTALLSRSNASFGPEALPLSLHFLFGGGFLARKNRGGRRHINHILGFVVFENGAILAVLCLLLMLQLKQSFVDGADIA